MLNQNVLNIKHSFIVGNKLKLHGTRTKKRAAAAAATRMWWGRQCGCLYFANVAV